MPIDTDPGSGNRRRWRNFGLVVAVRSDGLEFRVVQRWASQTGSHIKTCKDQTPHNQHLLWVEMDNSFQFLVWKPDDEPTRACKSERAGSSGLRGRYWARQKAGTR